jgi:hypothetical protein
MSVIINGTTGITTPNNAVTTNETVGGTLTVTGATTVGGVAVVAVAPSTVGNVLTSNGTAWASSAPSAGVATAVGQVPFSTNGTTFTATQKIVQGTSVASTSGTAIDFTSIPSWVKRITVMFNGVSASGTSIPMIQIGSTTFLTSGYAGSATWNGSATTANSAGFLTVGSYAAANILSGSTVLFNFSGNIWTSSSVIGSTGNLGGSTGGGYNTLSGVLDRIRITMVNGTDTFDAGSINIMYE